MLPPPLQSQAAHENAALRGTIRDSENKPIAGAGVYLQAKGETQPRNTHTDSQGGYSFRALRGGEYALWADKAGCGEARISSFVLGPEETKNVDLTLPLAKPPGSQPDSSQPPAFFDEPQFTVSGVTDTTNLGGHGSDTVVHTRETLAKETASLGGSPAGAPSAVPATTEETARARVQREPSSFAANHDLGTILIQERRAREAIPYLERAAELNPGDYENAYALALANADAGNYDSARDKAQALLAHHDKAELHHLLADVQEKLGNSLEAVREYQRAAELDSSEPYLFDWGSELLLHHAPEPALEVFAKGNRLFPHSVRMLVGMGASLFASGFSDQAVQRISQASDLNPDDPVPYLFLGKMQSAENTPSDKLVEELHRFVTLHPESADANYYYAVSLWKRQKTSPDSANESSRDSASANQVESLLNQAVYLDPKFGAAYLQLGILHSEQRDSAKAISDYQQAIQTSPDMEEAHYRLAQAYRQTGESEKAKAELQLYNQTAKESAQRAERERHEIRQFVYTLRDQPPAQNQ
ncbi:MAG: tetratricopeptide repeat protein [Candidatus Sulfotelmatobacter sp.]